MLAGSFRGRHSNSYSPAWRESSQVKVSKEESEDSPRSGQNSGEVHLRDQDQVPGTQDTVNSLQLFVQEVETRLEYELLSSLPDLSIEPQVYLS